VQSQSADAISYNVKINPMISWTWFGFLLTIIGAGLASWPKHRPEPKLVVSAPKPKAAPQKRKK
jgi:cytochrome c biogenesis factor